MRARRAGKARATSTARAIGIEIVNGGHDFGLPDFPDAQIDALIALLKDILPRWPSLTPARVVGHSDVAPDRKPIRARSFHGETLAAAGVSIWPEPTALQLEAGEDRVGRVQAQLGLVGYGVENDWRHGRRHARRLACVSASLPSRQHGRPDRDDETQALLAAVARLAH